MQLTTIEKTRSLFAMRAMAAALFPSLQWRHHGVGVLQGYVIEDREPEVRLHVWAPELVKPGMADSGDIHDHRFELISHVLAGQVGHEEIFPIEDESGEWAMLKLTHARAAKDTGYHGPTEPLPGRFRLERSSFIIQEGYTYKYPTARFHRNPVLGLAVTCVEKHKQTTASARILYPIKLPPVMAFGHELDWKLIGPVLHNARELLEGSHGMA